MTFMKEISDLYLKYSELWCTVKACGQTWNGILHRMDLDSSLRIGKNMTHELGLTITHLNVYIFSAGLPNLWQHRHVHLDIY